MTCQPISRGRNAEGFVVEKYPELVSLLEQDRQKIADSMRLRSRLHEDEMREEKFRVGSVDKGDGLSSPPARSNSKDNIESIHKEPKDIPESPLLKPKQSANDLIFQMDDENPLHPGEKSPVSRPAVPELSSRSNAIPLRGAKSIFDDEPDKTLELHRLRSPSMQFSDIQASPSDQATPKTMPWNAVSPSPGRPGLKEIMAEASDARTPASFFGPSPGSFPRRREVSSSSGNFPSKLSQKERKKMKQQQMQEAPEQTNQKSTPSSPWQPIPKPKLDDHPDDRQAASRPGARVSSSRPAMTLRQTVAGTPPPPPAQQRTSLNPKLVSPSPDKTDTNSVTTARSISITPNRSFSQSSRADPGYGNSANSFETTSPSPSLRQSRLSLASILEQQQVEKDEIREAATAKHNLHDIQVEQEFQEWWDQESKRVMMMQEAEVAEAAAAAATQRSSARGKGRGSGSAGKGKGHGGGNAAHLGHRGNNNAMPPLTASDDTTNAHRGGEGGGEKKRNSDRGRGQRSTSIGLRGRGARRGSERGKERGHH